MKRYVLPLLFCLVTVAILGVKPVQAASNVIYGSSTGLDPDATIKQVTFDRSGDNLVTTFQVQGQISQTYEYFIAIEFSQTYGPNYAYCIYAWEGGSYAGTTPGGTGTRIQGTVQGDTWTAYTPFSMIGDKTQNWVWVGTYNPSTKQWIDFHPTKAAINTGWASNFEVALPTQVTFIVQPNSIANNVTLTVDGTQNRFDSNGQLTLILNSATSHTFTLTPTLQSSNDIRYVFGGCSEWRCVFSGSDTARFVLSFDRDSSYNLTYKEQFLLTVSSEFGTVIGGGWYDEGSTAQFLVNPTVLKYSGFLGMLNLQYQCSGWTGDVVNVQSYSSVAMDGPKTIQATWATTYGQLFYGFIALVVGVPTVLIIIFTYRRRKSSGTEEEITVPYTPAEVEQTESTQPLVDEETEVKETPSERTIRKTKDELSSETTTVKEIWRSDHTKSTMFCTECGAKITRDSKFCKECGSSQL